MACRDCLRAYYQENKLYIMIKLAKLTLAFSVTISCFSENTISSTALAS